MWARLSKFLAIGKALGGISGWWSFLQPFWPNALSFLISLFAGWVVFLDQFPPSVDASLCAISIFIILSYCIHLCKESWPLPTTFFMRSGIVLWSPKNSVGVSHSKQTVGQSEDIAIWGPITSRVSTVFISGYNCSNSLISSIELSAISLKTGKQYQCLLDGMKPEETYGVPGRCSFTVTVKLPNSTDDAEGYSLEDYQRHVGDLEIAIKYGDSRKVKKVPVAKIINLYAVTLENFKNPVDPDRPRVAKRES